MHHDYKESDIESEALLIVEFANGCTGVCDLSGQTHLSKPRFLVKGDQATLAKYGLDPQETAMKAGDIDAAQEMPEWYATVKDKTGERRLPTTPGRWRTYYENIAHTLTGQAEPIVKPREMRRVMAVLEAAWQSARTGQSVVPDGES
jgi:scyllo-inositol 2-dehydrogenase (NADP+)